MPTALSGPAPALETLRLRLEPAREGHAEAIVAELQDPRLYVFMPGSSPPSLAELRAQFREVERGAPPGSEEVWWHWIAWSRAEEAYVGVFELMVEGAEANLGYLTLPRWWRRGYAFEACQRILTAMWDIQAVQRVMLDIIDGNAAALALAERLGFQRAPDAEPAVDVDGGRKLHYLRARPATAQYLAFPGGR